MANALGVWEYAGANRQLWRPARAPAAPVAVIPVLLVGHEAARCRIVLLSDGSCTVQRAPAEAHQPA